MTGRAAPTEPALAFDGVSFSYGGCDLVLSDATFSVPEGEFLVVIGPNGGGKTTLLKLALGLLEPMSGSVALFGLSPREGGRLVGYVPQEAGRNRDFPITALEVALQGCLGSRADRRGWRYDASDRDRARSALALMGMESFARHPMGGLSQGQRQRVLIARGLASEPRMLLLDEPLASIDQESRELLLSKLASLAGKKTVVMVSHDLSAISGHATAVACVDGSVHYHDSGEITADLLEEAYGQCPVELIAHGIPHRVLAVHRTKDHD